MSEVDPVSDFLAREQEALGDLGQEINLDDPSKDLNNFEDISNPGDFAGSNGGFVLLNGNSNTNGYDKEEPSSFGAFEDDQGLSDHHNVTSNGFSSDKESTFESVCPSEATEKWRCEFMERIKKKDEEEEIKKAELEDNGKKELENWYKMYKQQLETRTKDLRVRREEPSGNKHGDASKCTVNNTAVWDSICEMCDFQAKPKVAPDMSRMRGILLSLKSNC